MEEFLLHLWDEFDDLSGVCRHIATSAVAELIAVAAPVLAAIGAALLGGATVLLTHRQLLSLIA